LPDELGWATSTATFENGTARFARVDYTGQDAAWFQANYGTPDWGTETSGTISERSLKGGSAEVTVNLNTHNAFAWAINFDGDTTPATFGYLPSQLAETPTLTPPLANSKLQVVLRIPSPGAALPDLVKSINVESFPPGYSLVSLSFRATATGTTPEGQQAT